MVLPVYNLVEYSGQVMNKNKINIMSRNETKRNMTYKCTSLNIINVYQKEVGVQISNRRCTPGLFKGEVARSYPSFFVRKQ
jgi:hypothetical protein